MLDVGHVENEFKWGNNSLCIWTSYSTSVLHAKVDFMYIVIKIDVNLPWPETWKKDHMSRKR